jgi:hypothetical protein
LENSSKGIKIIHEKIEKKYFGDAIELLENAELIIFLGLNLYNKINIDRLKIKNNLENKRIYATPKGLTGPQREYVSEYFENKIINLSRKISLQKPEIYKYGSYELLSEKVRFHF